VLLHAASSNGTIDARRQKRAARRTAVRVEANRLRGMSTRSVGFTLGAMTGRPLPTPIDPRGPRTNQAVLALALAGGFALDWRPVVPVFAAVLLLGAAFGPRWGPVLRLYADVIRPRLGPPSHLEDPRPPRFAAAMGVVFLVAADVSFLAGAPGLGWALALVVAALAGLAATTGLCIGCELWLAFARRRRVELAA
jgi:hypothetical protein